MNTLFLFIMSVAPFAYPHLLVPKDPFEPMGIGQSTFFALNPSFNADRNEDYISLNSSLWLLDTKTITLSYWNGELRSGIGISYLDYGEFDYYEGASSEPLYTYRPYSFIVGGYVARRWDQELSMGMGFKYIQETILEWTSYNFLFDIGFTFRPRKFKKLRIEGEIRNFGFASGYVNKRYPNPRLIKGGIFYPIKENLGFKFSYKRDMWSEKDRYERFQVGIIGKIRDRIYILGGFSYPDELSSFSFGLGIDIWNFALQYAYLPSKNWDDIHFIGITTLKNAGF